MLGADRIVGRSAGLHHDATDPAIVDHDLPNIGGGCDLDATDPARLQERLKVPRGADLSFLRKQETGGDAASCHGTSQGSFLIGHLVGREPFAADPLGLPGDRVLVEPVRSRGVGGKMEAAAGGKAVVDAGLVPEFGGPVPMQAIAPGREQIAG